MESARTYQPELYPTLRDSLWPTSSPAGVVPFEMFRVSENKRLTGGRSTTYVRGHYVFASSPEGGLTRSQYVSEGWIDGVVMKLGQLKISETRFGPDREVKEHRF